MPKRKQILVTNEIYHVINRGVAASPIFNGINDYKRFLNLVEYYINSEANQNYSHFLNMPLVNRDKYLFDLKNFSPKLVEIYAYCFMPNHYHFLVKQLINDGIKNIFSKIQNSYAKYINVKYKRAGPLFQSRFKAIRIEDENTLLHVSRYIHLNPSSSCLIASKNLLEYKWSSLLDYLGDKNVECLNTSYLLNIIGNNKKYAKFVMDHADYQKKLDQIKHLILE